MTQSLIVCLVWIYTIDTEFLFLTFSIYFNFRRQLMFVELFISISITNRLVLFTFHVCNELMALQQKACPHFIDRKFIDSKEFLFLTHWNQLNIVLTPWRAKTYDTMQSKNIQPFKANYYFSFIYDAAYAVIITMVFRVRFETWQRLYKHRRMVSSRSRGNNSVS